MGSARPTAPPLDREPPLPLVLGLVAGAVARLLILNDAFEHAGREGICDADHPRLRDPGERRQLAASGGEPPVEDPFRKVNRTVASGASDRLRLVDETTLF
jgi:hypothetical protein